MQEQDWHRAGSWRGETLWASLERAAAPAGVTPTVTDGDETVALAALLARGRRIAGGLTACGLRGGDAVIIQSRNSLDAFAAMLGCFASGFVAVPLPPMFSGAQVAAVAASSRARAMIQLDENAGRRMREMGDALTRFAAVFVPDHEAGGALRPWSSCALRDAPAPAPSPPDDDALVLYSSGSTGSPKGVVHSGNTMRFAVEALARFHDLGPRDTVLVATEFGFVGGTILGGLMAFLAGASAVLMRRWDPEQALALIERHRVSYSLLMPTHVYDVMNCAALDRTDCSSFTRAILAGVPAHVREDAAKKFCARPLPMFGMSESIGHVTCAPDDPWDALTASDGRTLPGTEISIRDETGAEAPRGAVGDLFLRGPNRLLRYLGNAELTAQSILPGGWFKTGDRAMVDGHGFMVFAGRAKEIIRRGGVTIIPADIETALLKHPLIAEAAVVPVPDERLGEKACACIVTRNGAEIDLAEIARHLEAEKFARYQWPEHLMLFDTLPRTPSLKIRRPDLEAAVRRRLKGDGAG